MTIPFDMDYLRLLEEEDRRRARDNFLAFYMRMTGFEPPEHIKVLARLLQNMERDKVDRAMIFAPPRHAKSLTATILFPAWLMGRHPTTALMSVVHTQDYAGKVGRKVRNLLRSPLWPFDGVQLSDDSQAREYWTTPAGGEYNGFGATAGNQHGNPAEWLFMDDLVKGRKIAMSPHMRDEVWENYTTDMLSRLQGRAKQLMIFCLTGDTPVAMADGTRRALRDVRQGDSVLSWRDGAMKANMVEAFIPQGVDDILEMRAGGSIIRGNQRHPFLRLGPDGQPEWVPLGKLRKGDKIAQAARVHHKPSAKVFKDENEAFAIGYMLADGWVTVNNKGNRNPNGKTYQTKSFVTCLAATRGNDAKGAARARVLDYLGEQFGARWREQRFGYARTEKAALGRYLMGFGLHHGAKGKRLPEGVFSAPLAIRQALLSGFMKADGSIRTVGKHCTMTCRLANRELVEDLRHLARSCGHLVSNVTQVVRMTQAPNSPAPIEARNWSFRYHHLTSCPDGFRWVPVRSIVSAGREEVFDLTVANDANFIADGLVSHNTRWHQDDPAGRILPENYDGASGWFRDRSTNEPWFVLSMPAVAERDDDPLKRKPGEWLWPDRFGGNKLGGMQRRGGWMWSALYQQRPSPEEGLMFTADHIQRYNPADLDMTRVQIYGSSDYATTAEAGATDPDFTVHAVWAVDSESNIYLIDGWRGRTEPDKWVAALIRLMRRHKPLRWVEEQGQIIKSVGPFLRQILAKERVYVDRQQIVSSVNKEQRAQALLGMAAMGKFYLPNRAAVSKDFLPFLDAFEKELLQFPTGKHDDLVDAATLFGRFIDRILEGRPPAPKPSPHGDTLDDLWSRHDKDQDQDR